MTREIESARDLLALRKFPLSLQLYTLRVVDEALVRSGDASLRQRVARALQLGTEARALELAYRARPAREYGDEAKQLHVELDRALGGLFRFLATTLKSFGADSPLGGAAQQAIERLFPRGVRYVVQLPFVAQESTVRLMLSWATGEGPVVEALYAVQAGPLIERLAELHARFAEALPKAHRVTYADVVQARREGQQRLCTIVFLITAELMRAQSTAIEVAALEEALAAVLDQNAAIGRRNTRRRRGGATGSKAETEAETEADTEAEAGAETGAPENVGEELASSLSADPRTETEAEAEAETEAEGIPLSFLLSALGERQAPTECRGAACLLPSSRSKRAEAEAENEAVEGDPEDREETLAEVVVEANSRVLKAIENLGERAAEPWSPDARKRYAGATRPLWLRRDRGAG